MSSAERLNTEVIVLGAGFSKAVASELPLTDELGAEATRLAHVPRQELPRRRFKGGTFETWLSRLAEDQPYLSPAENLHNRGTFTEIIAALVEVLRTREQATFCRDGPGWLFEMLSVAHHRGATVITLNYDTMIEVAVASYGLWLEEGFGRRVTPDDVLGDLPPRGWPGQGAGFESVRQPVSMIGLFSGEQRQPAPRGSTFRLLKLHGSLDWFWSPGDSTGATLRRTTVQSHFREPRDEAEWREREAPGLEPFIVPPTATKSAYYNNPITRWVWGQATEALRRADRITLIGYSFPQTDLVMSGMLANSARSREVILEAVNTHPVVPKRHLRQLGTRPVEVIDGDDCVARFVEAYRDRVAREIVGRLRSLSGELLDSLALLKWMEPHSAFWEPGERYLQAPLAVRGGKDLMLQPMPRNVPADSSKGIPLSEIVAKLEGVERLVVRRPDGELAPFVAMSFPGVGGDHVATFTWARFWPAGAGPFAEPPSS